MDHESTIIEAARSRGIRAMPAAPLSGYSVALGMSVPDLKRFLDTLVRPPLDLDHDGLARAIIGRPSDMVVGDEPWEYEIIPNGFDADGFDLRATVNIPETYVAEVRARLNAAREEIIQ
jgi:hypothetical protein